MRRPPALISVLAALGLCSLASAVGATPGGVIVETASGALLDAAALAERLGQAEIAILGEVHDNPEHHVRQAWLIGQLGPGGVAFEMVPEAREDALAGLGPDEIAEALDWPATGWPDWALYRPVFEAAAGMALTGGGVARDDLMKAIERGAASAWGDDPERAGLDQPLAPALQAEVEADMVAAHCDGLPPEMAPGMVEAQRLRDARFAAAALRALERGGTGNAVLITGNGHARTDTGVPAALGHLAPERTVLSLGQIELAAGEAPEDAAGPPYDFVWFSDTAERDDPCAAFGDGSDG